MRKQVVLTSANITWQWDHNPLSILDAMGSWPEDSEAALYKLKAGQKNGKNMENLYDSGLQILPNFWDLVFYGSWSTADFWSLEVNLKWQASNEWDSIANCLNAWNSTPKNEFEAYRALLWGQRNNSKALKNYRACWKTDKERVMSLLQNIVTW